MADSPEHSHGWTTLAQEAHLREHRGPLDHKEQRIARLVAGLIVVLGLGFVAASVVAAAALWNLNDAADQIAALKDEVRDQKTRVAELSGQVELLQKQVRELGGVPVVSGSDTPPRASATATVTTPPTTSGSSTSTSTTSTTQPPPSGTCVLVACLRGAAT